MKPDECYNALLAQKLIGELTKRNMEGFYCMNRAEALVKVLQLLPGDALVSCGGSETLREMRLREALKERKYRFLDPDDAQGGAAKDVVAHEALAADYYLTGCNAITLDGRLVNTDGYGNRTSALIFGPKNVVVIAGMNKVAADVDAAMQRIKTHAAPLTLLIFKKDYASFDDLALAADAACAQLVVTSFSMTRGRIKVILVGESLGF